VRQTPAAHPGPPEMVTGHKVARVVARQHETCSTQRCLNGWQIEKRSPLHPTRLLCTGRRLCKGKQLPHRHKRRLGLPHLAANLPPTHRWQPPLACALAP
jgi:hypothetical protein